MSYDNGGVWPGDEESFRYERINGLERLVSEQDSEIRKLKKQLEERDYLIMRLKSNYVHDLEIENRQLKICCNNFRAKIQELEEYIQKQSRIEDVEKFILSKVWDFLIIRNEQHCGFYVVDFFPKHYRISVDDEIKDYLISKGVKNEEI